MGREPDPEALTQYGYSEAFKKPFDVALLAERIRTLVEEAAQSFEQPDAVIRWHYEQPERLNEYEVRAVERNVIDWVLQRARVEDQPTLFSTLMEPPALPDGTAA